MCVATNYTVAQIDLSRTLLSSNGQSSVVLWGEVSYSVGEPVVFTGSDSTFGFGLTQGFQQPDMNTFSVLDVTMLPASVSCIGNNDGKISASGLGGTGTYTYFWSDGQSGSQATNLSVGVYTVTITDASGNTASNSVTLLEEQIKCGEVKIYKGFTPNGDGHNDNWRITGIENFDNHVAVFNRWGDEIWEGNNYDNSTIVWSGENKHGQIVPDGTYFYVVKYKNKTEKGWVEVTR